MPRTRLNVLKTYKLYIGGKFPRTESGRTMTATHATDGSHLAHYSHASRKDLRDAIVAARKAFPSWRSASAYLRGQILYRAAEMLESRADSIATELSDSSGSTKKSSVAEVEASIDRLVYYAGWTDKISQLFGSVNPVASSHFNFSVPEPTGVVGVVCPDEPGLLALVTLTCQVIATGNSAVVLASESLPLPALSFAEVLATSDLPGGVINLLTGSSSELAPWLAEHMDVNAIIDGSGEKKRFAEFQAGAASNLKRVHDHSQPSPEAWFSEAAENPYQILDTLEFKTAWHPIGV